MSVDLENNDTKKVLLFANFIERTVLIKFDYYNYSISNYYSDNICLSQPTLYAAELTLDNKNYIIQITSARVFINEDNLNKVIDFATVVDPVEIKLKSRRGFLYIYNKNNLLIRYNIHQISK